jgi:FkbM family methyltransferase
MHGPRTTIERSIRSFQLHWRLDLTDHLQRLIAAQAHELAMRDVTTRLLGPGEVAIDVGANVGAHALAWGREVGPSGRVFAFEPAPPNYKSLAKNIESNDLEGVVIPIDLALGDQDSTLLLAHARGGSTSGGYSAFGLGASYQVEQRRLDDVIRELPISGPVRLIKIDVEGWESRVLEGAKEAIERWRPFIALERNSGYDVTDLDEALRRLMDNQYTLFQIVTTGLRRAPSLVSFDPNSVTARSSDILLVPPRALLPRFQ